MVNIDKAEKWKSEIEIQSVLDHPDYDWENHTNLNDISILTTTKKIKFRPDFQPVCLPSTKRDFYDSKKALTLGWGVLENNKSLVTLIELTINYCSLEGFLTN